jgi:2-haloacid dehalogenase
VLLRKRCPEHGRFEALVYSDAELYMRQLRFNKPGTLPLPLEFQTEVKDGSSPVTSSRTGSARDEPLSKRLARRSQAAVSATPRSWRGARSVSSTDRVGDPVQRVVIFDVLGTLFSLDAVRARLSAIGAPAATLEAWFERTLHSALTLTTIGEFRPFREVARSALQTTLAQLELDVAQAEEILTGLSEVQAHDDAAAALDRLAGADARIVALTNSGAQQTEEILEQAKLRDRFERLFSVSDVGAYKPDRRPYEHVVTELDVDPAEATLVAAHAWDVVGARAAGLESIWVDRLERRWPLPVPEPARAHSLADAAEMLLAAG